MPRKRKTRKAKGRRGRPPKNQRLLQTGITVAVSDANISQETNLQTTNSSWEGRGEAELREAQKKLQELMQKAEWKKDAPQEHYFILCNGKPLKNIKELADVLEDLEDHVFNFHVQPGKNDFATWIKDIFKDIELAETLAGVKDKKHMQLVLYKHITHKLW